MMTIKASDAECRAGMVAVERAHIEQGNLDQSMKVVSSTPCAKSIASSTSRDSLPLVANQAQVNRAAIG